MKFDTRMTELVAIGSSVAANCQSCVEYHVGKAAEQGVDSQEIAQAVDVGRMVRRGAAAKVDKTVERLRGELASVPEAHDGCGSAAR
jgi:AhpD family alkylhydroperoxidase